MLNSTNLLAELRKRVTHIFSTLRSRSLDYREQLVKDVRKIFHGHLTGLGRYFDINFECWCIYTAFNSQFSRQALPKFTTGELRVTVDSTFSLEAATKAHERMRENKNIGKILITIQDLS